jgi:hypothetical protein
MDEQMQAIDASTKRRQLMEDIILITKIPYLPVEATDAALIGQDIRDDSSIAHLNIYALVALAKYTQNEHLYDYELLHNYRADFGGWTRSQFSNLAKVIRQPMWILLRQRGIYTGPIGRSFYDQLKDVADQEELLPWQKDELMSVQFHPKSEASKLQQQQKQHRSAKLARGRSGEDSIREEEPRETRGTNSQPESWASGPKPTPDTMQFNPDITHTSATPPEGEPAHHMLQQPQWSSRQQIPLSQTPTTQKTSPPSPRQQTHLTQNDEGQQAWKDRQVNPQQESQTRRVTGTGVQSTQQQPRSGPQNNKDTGDYGAQDDEDEETYFRIPPLEVPNEPGKVDKELKFINRWDKEMNYSGKAYDILDDIVAIFLERCHDLGIRLSQLHGIFPCILTGAAKRYYINHIPRKTTFAGIYRMLERRFDNGINKDRYYADFTTLTYETLRSDPENQGKLPGEVLQLLFDRLQLCQRGLGTTGTPRDDEQLRMTVTRAVGNMPELQKALLREADTFEQMTSDLRRSFATAILGQSKQFLVDEPPEQEQYFADSEFDPAQPLRRQHPSPGHGPSQGYDSNRGNCSGGNTTTRWQPRCYICDKIGCFSARHTKEEKKVAQRRYQRMQHFAIQSGKEYRNLIAQKEDVQGIDRDPWTTRWQKRCYICDKIGCYSTNHSEEDNKVAKRRYLRMQQFAATQNGKEYKDFVADYEDI